LAQVAQDQNLQRRLRRCSPVEAAALAQGLGHDVRCGDALASGAQRKTEKIRIERPTVSSESQP
jgi:hypothetical protein